MWSSMARTLTAVLLVTYVVGCSSQPEVPPPAPSMPMPAASTGPTPAQSLDALYNDAIHRSAVIAQSKAVAHPLLTIDASHRMTTVVTWTTVATAVEHYHSGDTTIGVDVWVTLAPQVHDLCRGFPTDPAALTLRLQQLLGLPPRPEARVFVVMDVPTSSLFRPCADPDLAKTACGWGFPPRTGDKYKAWFADQVTERYRESPDGYPWTRLGYTYDWAAGSSGFGATELVMRKGTQVVVKARVPTDAYCHPTQN